MFTGYPWDPLALTLIPPGLANAAWLTGTYALSGVVVVAAGAQMLLVKGRWRLAAVFVPLFALATLAGADRCGIATCVPEPASMHLLRVVQPNLPEDERPTPEYAENNFQALARLSRRADPAAPPRLLIRPAGAMREPG